MAQLDKLLLRFSQVNVGGTAVPVPTPTATQQSPTPPTILNLASGLSATYNAATNAIDISANAAQAIAGQNAVTLSNGLNFNVATGGLPTIRITGPSAAFSIGGLSLGGGSPSPGQQIAIINTTAQPMTIVQEDTNSTATYRININAGVSSTLPGYSKATFVYDGSISRWQLQPNAVTYRTHIDVREYGAQGNANYQNGSNLKWYLDSGLTTEATDDSNAIVAAINEASQNVALGIPAVVRLSGSHYIKTYSQTSYTLLGLNTFFVVPSGVTFEGVNQAAIRVGPGLNASGNGWAFFASASNITNVTFRGIYFDGNGQSGAPTSQHNSFIALLGSSTSNIVLEDCTFANQSGWNTIIISAVGSGTVGSNIRVENCSFLNIGNSATLTDHVALYLQAQGISINGCNFFNDPAVSTVPRNNGQAIQCQGIGVSVSGCSFTNHSNAILFGSAFNNPVIDCSKVSITGNSFTLCSAGVQFFQSVNSTLSDIAIVGNTFGIASDTQGAAEAAVIQTSTNGGTGAGCTRTTIVGNTMFFIPSSTIAEANPIAIQFTSVVTGMTIASNHIEGFDQGAIVLTPAAASNPNAPPGNVVTSDLKLQDINIHGNTIKNCGNVRQQVILLQCDTIYKAGSRISVWGNSIWSSQQVTTGIACAVAGSTITIVGNITSNILTPFSISSSNGITGKLQGPVIGDDGFATRLGLTGSNVMFTGQPLLQNSQWIEAWDGSSTARNIIGMDVNGATRITPNADAITAIGAPSLFTGASAGDVVMAQGRWLRAPSAVTHRMIGWDGSNVFLAADADTIKIGTAPGTASGGSAATIGSGVGTGGNNPTATAQSGWLKIIDSNGVARFIPLWT